MTPHDARRRHALRVGLALAGATALPARSQGWPSRTVAIVSPYPPGGTNDVVARLVANGLQKALGQTFVVENQAGAGGIVGAAAVRRAAPDGHTLLLANNAVMAIQPLVKAKPPYEPLTDFTPIAKYADSPLFVGVNGELPVRSVAELVALAKKQPGVLNYGSAGAGSFGNFSGELFKISTGTDIVHIPQAGSAAALNELLAGRIQLLIDPVVLSQAKNGRIRVLATTNRERIAGLPEIPTLKEAGGPDLSLVGWFGLFGPAGLNPEVVAKIAAASAAIAADPELHKAFAAAGLVPALLTGNDFRALLQSDLKRYAEVKERARIAQVE